MTLSWHGNGIHQLTPEEKQKVKTEEKRKEETGEKDGDVGGREGKTDREKVGKKKEGKEEREM